MAELADVGVAFEGGKGTKNMIKTMGEQGKPLLNTVEIQEATPAINGAPLSQRDEFKLCKGSFRTDLENNCLSMTNERAWSSPIYINKP